MNEETRLASLLENVDRNAKEYASTLTLEQMLCSKCTKPMTRLESLQLGVCLWCRPIKAGGKQPESAPSAEAKAGSLQQPCCAWRSVNTSLPAHSQRVICKYDGVYDARIVTFWRDDGGNTHFGLPGEPDGKGSQPATHWTPLP